MNLSRSTLVLGLLAASLLSACANLPTPGAGSAAGALGARSDGPHVTLQAPGSTLALDAEADKNAVASSDAASAPAGAASDAAPSTAAVAATEASMVPTDPLEPERKVDLYDNAAATDLWARVRKGFAIPDLDDDYVRRGEQLYASKPDYVRRMTERGGRYLFHVVEEVEKRGMPTELALLPFIESAFNPQAMSSARASGMWQFVPSTGRTFALKQNLFRDDRRDVLASTRAALDYLDRLHNMFGDWHLALAAYNWGEGNVQRAIARNQKAGLPTDYASLRMPDETRFYVPKLQAVKNIILHPDTYGLALPPLLNHPYFLSVPISRDIDVDLAARLAGVPLEEFKQLNPQMNKPVILAAGTEQVLLPYDNANQFIHNLARHQGQLASWTAWVAPKTLRPAEAARQLGMSEAQLRDINRIPPRMVVKAGSTLLVPRTAGRNADVSENLADNATMALAPDLPPMRRLTLRAGRGGESVAAVARRYHTTPAQVAAWNRVAAGGSFRPGAAIVVMVPQRGARGQTAVRARGARSGGGHVAAPTRRSAAAAGHAHAASHPRSAAPARPAKGSRHH
jgi:membrane-bound lytic murein transglycosylase D